MSDDVVRPNAGARLLNAVLFGIAIITAIVALVELRKVGSPGAPVAWVYVAIALSTITAVLLYPKIFIRLPRRERIGAGLMVFVSIVVLNVEVEQMAATWERTSAGAKEIADQRAADRQRAIEKASQQERLKAEQAAKASEDAEEKRAEAEAQKPELCQSLLGQVVDNDKVLEVNNVAVQDSYDSDEVLKCVGDAVTSRGDTRIEYGLTRTPQGKALVFTRFPDM